MIKRVKACRLASPIVVALLLNACAAPNIAPVESRLVAQEQASFVGYHVVRAGETLYSIAFSYGLDYRQLASWNGIGNNFLIFPGQRLKLSGPRLVERQNNGENVKNPSDSEGRSTTNRGISSTGGSRQPGHSSSQTSRQSSTQEPRQSNSDRSTHSVTASSQSASSGTNTSVSQYDGPSVVNWQWPAPGDVIQRFSSASMGNKGLNIAGKKGEPVRSAADGVVVYAGGGLRGFGNLVIVKHNDDFLSAYAHNSALHVKENDAVKAGQLLADIGDSGTDRVQLHFEIRYQGQPVDPLKYLPKR